MTAPVRPADVQAAIADAEYILQMELPPANASALDMASERIPRRRRVAQALIDLSVSLERQQQWQDISTAPKDGTLCIITAFYEENHFRKSFWKTYVGHYQGEYSNGDQYWNDTEGRYNIHPTYWMPLPTAPQKVA